MTLSPAARLAQALIRCRSVTPADDGALPLVAARLSEAGFTVELLTFSEPSTPDVLNLFAKIGEGAPCFLFNGHTDVVPPGNVAAWRHDPFGGTVEEGRLYGRGACDMKGGVAAFVEAAVAHVHAHGAPKRGSIVLLLTGDEEGPAVNGTAKLLDWALARGERFDAALVGEPTNPDRFGEMIKIGRRGSLTGDLTVHGTQGHVAYPQRADNPIPHLLRLLDGLLARPLDEGTAAFDPSNLEVVTVDTGNPSANVIPAEARARFNVRFNDLWSAETLRSELETRLASVARGARITLAFQPCNAHAFLTESGPCTAAVFDAVYAATGHNPTLSTSGGTSDARFIAPHAPVVEFGLVARAMHGIDEHLVISELDALTAVYRTIIEVMLRH